MAAVFDSINLAPVAVIFDQRSRDVPRIATLVVAFQKILFASKRYIVEKNDYRSVDATPVAFALEYALDSYGTK